MGGFRWLLMSPKVLPWCDGSTEAICKEGDSEGRYQHKGILRIFVESFLLYEIVPKNNVIRSEVEYTFLWSVTSLKLMKDCYSHQEMELFLQTISETSSDWTEHSNLNPRHNEYSE